MEEAYTCKCGNQEWVIYNGRVECTKCETNYVTFTGWLTVRDFNEHVRITTE